MGYYPIFLNIEEKTVLVVGGGSVAQRKIGTLLKYGASVNVVSKELTKELEELVAARRVKHIGSEFSTEHLDEAFLVFAATDDKQLNRQISQSAREKGVLVNAVDQPEDCDFIVPSCIKKGYLSIAISTSGKSPALAKKIREQLTSQFGNEYDTFLFLMGRIRKEVHSLGFSQEENSRIFREIVDSDILKSLAEDDWGKVEIALRKILPECLDLGKCMNLR